MLRLERWSRRGALGGMAFVAAVSFVPWQTLLCGNHVAEPWTDAACGQAVTFVYWPSFLTLVSFAAGAFTRNSRDLLSLVVGAIFGGLFVGLPRIGLGTGIEEVAVVVLAVAATACGFGAGRAAASPERPRRVSEGRHR